MVAFDIYTNLKLEEALEKKQKVKTKINNETYTADPGLRKAVTAKRPPMELFRKEVKGESFRHFVFYGGFTSEKCNRLNEH